MAKFHNYYVLCPLIDQKSFLGVSQDKEEEYIIVTLGRNVVNKYRLSDQKQVGGWTSRDHITSAVVYDRDQDSYVGIFNNNTIKIWKEDIENLDKVKKYKFSVNMLKLVPRDNQSSLIIFVNGNCAALPYALENRKTYESRSLIRETDIIVDTACYTMNNIDYVCHIVKNNKDKYEIINCAVRNELGDFEKSKLNKIKVSRPDSVYVVGKFINTMDKVVAVYILWSDSKMTAYDLNKKSWKTIGTVPWISTHNSVSLAWMGKDHLILFGSNMEQDGAIIIAYNVILGVGSCKYPMKMYSEDAKLYCCNSRIILEASNHIGMLPYLIETKRNLSSLLGSHEVTDDEFTMIADWGTSTENTTLFEAADIIKKHSEVGFTERSICAKVIPPLLEKNDVRKVLTVIKDVKDIPESVLVQLLNYAIKLLNIGNIDVTNHDEFLDFCLHESDEKFKLLNCILDIAFSDALLIPYLRNGLTLEDTMFLMSYITFLLVDSDMKVDTDYESKLLDWCTLLIDAFYQQYLMTKDEKVTYVLQKTLSTVIDLVKQLSIVNDTMMTLKKFLSGKETVSAESLSYSIEMMEI